MKQFLIILILIYSSSFVVNGQTYFTGHTTITFTDSSRSNRNIPTEIYYPAVSTGDNVAAANGNFPIIVFGHGFVMVWSAYENIWTSLTQNGFIVAFPKTETGLAPSHTEFAKDLAFLITALGSENINTSSLLYQHIDSLSCVMGHSMGGGAALLSVQYNSSIDAVATLAAAETNPSAIAACAGITLPSLYIAGGNDCITPPSTNQLPMYTATSSICKSIITITGGSHCQFAESNFNCSFGEATCSPAPTISRSFQHSVTDSVLIPWLKNYLKNECNSGISFQNLLTTSANITSQQNCVICQTSSITTSQDSETSLYISGKTIYIKSTNYIKDLKVINSLGQPVLSSSVNAYEVTKEIELPASLYYIILTGDDFSTTRALMIR